VTGFAFLDDKNNNSGGVVAWTSWPPTSSTPRTPDPAEPSPPTRTSTAGSSFVASASGTVTITYHKNHGAGGLSIGRIYTSGLTSPFANVDRTGGAAG